MAKKNSKQTGKEKLKQFYMASAAVGTIIIVGAVILTKPSQFQLILGSILIVFCVGGGFGSYFITKKLQTSKQRGKSRGRG